MAEVRARQKVRPHACLGPRVEAVGVRVVVGAQQVLNRVLLAAHVGESVFVEHRRGVRDDARGRRARADIHVAEVTAHDVGVYVNGADDVERAGAVRRVVAVGDAVVDWVAVGMRSYDVFPGVGSELEGAGAVAVSQWREALVEAVVLDERVPDELPAGEGCRRRPRRLSDEQRSVQHAVAIELARRVPE